MLTVTDKAKAEVKRLRSLEPESDKSHLRVMVVGGGCSGMSYKLGFEKDEPTPSDKIFEFEGEKLVIDNKSLLFLNGTELDFSDGLNGKGFVFNNPNAKRTCGCGSSFSA
jgi:iron-sulfur cluster assembly protein